MKELLVALLLTFCLVYPVFAEGDEVSSYVGFIRDLKVISEEEAYWTESGEFIQKNIYVEIEMIFVTIKDEKSWIVASPGIYQTKRTIYDGPGGVYKFLGVLRDFHLDRRIILINGIEKSDFEIDITEIIFTYMESEESILVYKLSLEESEELLPVPEPKILLPEEIQMDDA